MVLLFKVARLVAGAVSPGISDPEGAGVTNMPDITLSLSTVRVEIGRAKSCSKLWTPLPTPCALSLREKFGCVGIFPTSLAASATVRAQDSSQRFPSETESAESAECPLDGRGTAW